MQGGNDQKTADRGHGGEAQMSTYVISGGNSGIGLQVARNLLADAHRVIILGRDERKGQAALASFGSARDRATFVPGDLSTHDGVRDAARQIDALSGRIDGLLHSAGAFVTGDVRTVDGIPLFAAVGYFSRYHLTQLLLPNLLKVDEPRVVMMSASLKRVPKVHPEKFPYLEGLAFQSLVPEVKGAAMCYASHLNQAHPKLFAGIVCPGLVRTNIFASAPWYIRGAAALAGPFVANSVETAANNPTQALLRGRGPTAIYWDKAADFNAMTPISVDPRTQQAVVEASRKITGV